MFGTLFQSTHLPGQPHKRTEKAVMERFFLQLLKRNNNVVDFFKSKDQFESHF